jgi:D-aminoacyl-tRNA deacylase
VDRLPDDRPVVVVVSVVDPVAQAVAERWGTPPAVGDSVDGVPLRELGPRTLLLRRAGPHIHDEHLDRRLPEKLRAAVPTLVFPSIHRSEQNVRSLTVHPLGNLGPEAEVGGRPRTLGPTDPRRMTATLRRLAEGGPSVGVPATFEATHHGPGLDLPAYFVEIGFGDAVGPAPEEVRLLAEVIPEAVPDPGDRVALGVGGGHYAPHFTELAVERRWAFGHLISRHALTGLDRETFESAVALTPGAEGALYSRAADESHPAVAGVLPRLRDGEAARRGRSGATATPSCPPASGT